MNDLERKAFEAGTGGIYSIGDSAFFFKGILATVLFIWLGWIVIKAYQGFAEEGVPLAKSGGLALRGMLLTVIITYIITL